MIPESPTPPMLDAGERVFMLLQAHGLSRGDMAVRLTDTGFRVPAWLYKSPRQSLTGKDRARLVYEVMVLEHIPTPLEEGPDLEVMPDPE